MGSVTWTRENLRHALSVLRYGRNPAATVYDSLGTDFFAALAPGWLNLGLWEGDGADSDEAPVAVRRLVEAIARELPAGGDVLDVGNGLGEQDPLIAATAETRTLVAVNITLSQLLAGKRRLAEARANGVNADATRLPMRDASFDGVISVEAAFHFSSRAAFFDEAFRVLRPGGVLTMSDVATARMPLTPGEAVAAFTQMRAWGLGTHAAATADEIVAAALDAGFIDVRAEPVGERVIGPALRFVRDRLDRDSGQAPLFYRLAVRIMVRQIELLWERGMLDYILLHGTKPAR
ncbi:MAG TPA: methyltransferase domain-containing protein [Actinomycetota bacterium]|nr:methyltransferase domain-containing protein [Actinomycetota bacterium]